MKWILPVSVLLLLSGCHSPATPLPEPESKDQALVVEPEQRTITFVGRLTDLERTVQYRSVPWVGTFVNKDDKAKRFVIGGNDHPLFSDLGTSAKDGGPLEIDVSQPSFRLKGRSCPIEEVWELTAWEKAESLTDGFLDTGATVAASEREVSGGQDEVTAPQMPPKLTGTWIVRWDNGRKKYEGTYKNGTAHGQITSWNTAGQKINVSEFSDGKQCGTWTTWYDNGNMKSQESFKGGVLVTNSTGFGPPGGFKAHRDGTRTRWSENGHKVLEENYTRNEKHGQSAMWYSDKTPRQEENYRAGLKHGRQTYWDYKGQIEGIRTYSNGQCLAYQNYRDGKLIQKDGSE